jgi:RNA polymerase sigma factor (sigma-70 family)
MTKDNQYSWLEILRTGDIAGIKALYAKFQPGIVKWVVNNRGDEEEAKDVFQEAVLVVYKKLNNEGLELHTATFSTYLFAISKKIWLKKLEKQGKSMVTFDAPPELIDDSDWDAVLQEEERYRLFRKKFNSLTDNCRQLLSLFFAKTPMKEIIAIMGFGSVEYAKKRKFQCKEHLVALVRSDAGFDDLKLEK